MASRVRMGLIAAAMAVSFAVSLRAGGWSVVSVDNLPEFVRVGEPFTMTYAVRQHGVSLLSDLRGRIEARLGDGAVVFASAVPVKPGYYKATLTLPRAGNWTLSVSSGFVESITGRPTGADMYRDGSSIRLVAVSTADSRPAAQTMVERGLHLYVAKGCVTCHPHARSDVRSLEVGPDLTKVDRTPEYLRTVLSHGVRGRDQEDDVLMPNLGLRPPEIDALVAFLQTAGQPRVTKTKAP